jgi:hypothetical protein
MWIYKIEDVRFADRLIWLIQESKSKEDYKVFELSKLERGSC